MGSCWHDNPGTDDPRSPAQVFTIVAGFWEKIQTFRARENRFLKISKKTSLESGSTRVSLARTDVFVGKPSHGETLELEKLSGLSSYATSLFRSFA